MLVLSLVLGIATQQLDYTNAFCQEPLDQTLHAELPKRFEVPSKVLHLQKSFFYGLRQSPLKFYKHLRDWLEIRWFKKSIHDDFLFTNGDVMALFWLEACMFYAKDDSSINTIISSLKDEFLLEV